MLICLHTLKLLYDPELCIAVTLVSAPLLCGGVGAVVLSAVALSLCADVGRCAVCAALHFPPHEGDTPSSQLLMSAGSLQHYLSSLNINIL